MSGAGGVRWGAVALSMLCAVFVFAAGAVAQEAPVKAFVESIYKPYLKKNFKGIDYSKPATLRRYFEPQLADAIIADMRAAAKRNEVPTLDGDPFIDAQDWEISNLSIEVAVAGPRMALVTVNFVNAREPKTIKLDVFKTPAGWRIAEIYGPSGSLRKLFKLQ